MSSPRIFSMAFAKEAMNKFPDIIGMSVIALIAFPFAVRGVHKEVRERPFTYRNEYTVWRDDDPRSKKMLKQIEKYNWQPPAKMDGPVRKYYVF
ncbi:hypothetical protein BIW11_14021 [Tropilaelaps mercedesae]|uniref:Uncharacterized protein n=1 Tax=Tropilaelaps mercedesae TaxID=418985 RepID=A0A1V9WZG7_9ACAR|nr:hypothetical protein BIW11_14021 [Tropilaelaps mercedesae]